MKLIIKNTALIFLAVFLSNNIYAKSKNPSDSPLKIAFNQMNGSKLTCYQCKDKTPDGSVTEIRCGQPGSLLSTQSLDEKTIQVKNYLKNRAFMLSEIKGPEIGPLTFTSSVRCPGTTSGLPIWVPGAVNSSSPGDCDLQIKPSNGVGGGAFGSPVTYDYYISFCGEHPQNGKLKCPVDSRLHGQLTVEVGPTDGTTGICGSGGDDDDDDDDDTSNILHVGCFDESSLNCSSGSANDGFCYEEGSSATCGSGCLDITSNTDVNTVYIDQINNFSPDSTFYHACAYHMGCVPPYIQSAYIAGRPESSLTASVTFPAFVGVGGSSVQDYIDNVCSNGVICSVLNPATVAGQLSGDAANFVTGVGTDSSTSTFISHHCPVWSTGNQGDGTGTSFTATTGDWADGGLQCSESIDAIPGDFSSGYISSLDATNNWLFDNLPTLNVANETFIKLLGVGGSGNPNAVIGIQDNCVSTYTNWHNNNASGVGFNCINNDGNGGETAYWGDMQNSGTMIFALSTGGAITPTQLTNRCNDVGAYLTADNGFEGSNIIASDVFGSGNNASDTTCDQDEDTATLFGGCFSQPSACFDTTSFASSSIFPTAGCTSVFP